MRGSEDDDWKEHPSLGDDSSASERLSISRIRAGDTAAFQELFLRYGAVLCSFLNKYVHSRETAEDLVHDLFLALWQDRATWTPRGTIESYLFLAAKNRAYNYLRHERVEQRWQQRSAREIEAGVEASPADEQLEAAERQAIVVQAIAELPERARAVATLRWVDGLTYPEIAQRLGMTVKGVEKGIARAFTLIQRRLIQ